MGKIIKNYLYNISYQLLATVLPLMTLPYVSRILGPNNIGINGIVDSLVAIFLSVGMLGTNVYANREIAYCAGDKESVVSAFCEILLLRIFLFLGTIFIFLGVVNKSGYKMYYMIQVLYIAGNFLDISWLYIGLEKLRPVVIRNYIVKIIGTIAIFLFVNSRDDLIIYMLINCGCAFVSGISMYPMAVQYIRGCRPKKINCVKHILPSLALFLPQAASQVYLQLDKIMLNIMTGDTVAIGYYTQSEKLVKVPIVLATALTTVLMPRIANEYIQKEHSKIKKYIENAFDGILFLEIPCMIGLVGVAKNLIKVVLGNEFAEAYTVFMIMVPVILPVCLSNITGAQFLTAANRTRKLTASYVTGAMVDLFINMLLIPRLGVYGAAIGTIAAEYTVYFIQKRAVINEIGPIKILSKQIKSVCAGIMMLLVVNYIGGKISGDVLTLTIQVIAGVVAYFLTLLVMRDKRLTVLIKVKLKM